MAGEGRAVTSSWRMLWEMVMMSVVITPEEREAVSWEIRRAKLTPTEESAGSGSGSARTWVSLARTCRKTLKYFQETVNYFHQTVKYI